MSSSKHKQDSKSQQHHYQQTPQQQQQHSHEEATEEPTTPRAFSRARSDSGSETETESSRANRKRKKGKGKEVERVDRDRRPQRQQHQQEDQQQQQQKQQQQQPKKASKTDMSSSRSRHTSSGRRHTSSKGKVKTDDWSEVTDPEERRRIQNRIAQRKFREKAREQKERAEREQRNQEHAASSYMIPGPEDLGVDDVLSGVPWGGPSMRYVVARGHASASSQPNSEGRRASDCQPDETTTPYTGGSGSSVSGSMLSPPTLTNPLPMTSDGGAGSLYSFSEDNQYLDYGNASASGSSRNSSDYNQLQLGQEQFYDAFYYDYDYNPQS